MLIALAILVLAVPAYYVAWSMRKFIVVDQGNLLCSVCQHVTTNYEMTKGEVVCISCSHREAN